MSYAPPYGNLVELNTCRVICDAINEDLLRDIVDDYLELLGSSVAIYEKNGDYALGIFSSGWCQFMDQTSRKLCDTEDNKEALSCGKWLCHESCWGISKECMDRGEPFEDECFGGIKIYAVPIHAGDEVVGAINFGFGDPPKDPKKLKELAERYHVSVDKLSAHAQAYRSRLPFIIDIVRSHLKTAAELIGQIVKNKQAEEVLRASEERFKFAAEGSTVGLFDWDFSEGIGWGSPRFYELLGYQEGELLPNYKNYIKMLHPEDRDRVIEALRAHLKERKPYDNEFRMQTKSGEYRWFRECGQAIWNDDGKPVRMSGSIQDITERKRAEEALRESEIMNRSLLEGSPVCNKIIDLDFTLRYMSAAGLKQLKIPDIKPYCGQTYPSKFYPESMRAPLIKNLKLAMAGQISTVEALVHDMEGNEVWYHTTFVPVFDDDDRVKYVIASSVDITERKRAEEVLRESEQRFRGAFETAGHGMTLTKPDGGYLAVNPAFCKITGYSKAELLATDFQSITHPDDLDANLNLLQRMLAGEIFSYQFEKRYLHKQGHVVWVQLNASHVIDKNDKPLYFVNQIQNITEQKQVEKQVLESRERLRNFAARLQVIREEERTEIAREIHDKLGQTLAGLKMDMFWLVDRLPRHWKKIPQRAHTMISLLDSTIDFVRKFSMELRPSILDDLGLAAAIEWQVNDFTTRTDCKYTFDIDINDLRPDHNRDTAIFRILQEALTNVAQHANADQVRVSLARSDSQLVLTVKDNGTGMDEEKKTSSSSLGLIGMRERAGALGGKIMIEKAEEGGTRVTLTVPCGGGVT